MKSETSITTRWQNSTFHQARNWTKNNNSSFLHLSLVSQWSVPLRVKVVVLLKCHSAVLTPNNLPTTQSSLTSKWQLQSKEPSRSVMLQWRMTSACFPLSRRTRMKLRMQWTVFWCTVVSKTTETKKTLLTLNFHTTTTRSNLIKFQVPSKWTPWFLLSACSFLSPNKKVLCKVSHSTTVAAVTVGFNKLL